jgi:hypothetical protein
VTSAFQLLAAESLQLIFKVKGVPTNLQCHLAAVHSIIIDITVSYVQANAL